MAYGRQALQIGSSLLRSTPLGGLASGVLGKLGALGGLFSEGKKAKRLRSRARLEKLEAKVRAGTITARGIARLRHKSTGPYVKQAMRAKYALEHALQSGMGQSDTSPTVGAGPMLMPTRPRRLHQRTRRRKATAVVRRRARSARRTSRRGRQPAALARYWRERRRVKRAAKTLGKA